MFLLLSSFYYLSEYLFIFSLSVGLVLFYKFQCFSFFICLFISLFAWFHYLLPIVYCFCLFVCVFEMLSFCLMFCLIVNYFLFNSIYVFFILPVYFLITNLFHCLFFFVNLFAVHIYFCFICLLFLLMCVIIFVYLCLFVITTSSPPHYTPTTNTPSLNLTPLHDNTTPLLTIPHLPHIPPSLITSSWPIPPSGAWPNYAQGQRRSSQPWTQPLIRHCPALPQPRPWWTRWYC